MRNEGPARLYVSRKQLVMVVTYSSSVTLPVWAASHQPVPLSNPGRAPKPSISLLTPLPSLSCMLFVSSSDPASSLLSSRLLHLSPPPRLAPDNTHCFFHFCPRAHVGPKMFAKTSAVTRHSCPPANAAHLSLSRRHAL